MANRALLLGVDTAVPPREYEPEEGWLGANYSIPILWLSLFDSSNMVVWPGTLDSSISYTALIGLRDACTSLSRRRIDAWQRRWPEDLTGLGGLWLDFVSGVGAEYLGVWTEDLSGMIGDDPWAEALASYLRGLDEPQSAGFNEAFAQSYLTIDPDTLRLTPAGGAAFHLVAAGYSWSRQAPWESSA